MRTPKQSDKVGTANVKDVKTEGGATTITLTPEPLEPDWKAIAYQGADALDDLYLFVRFLLEDKKIDSPLFDLIVKKKRQMDKHLIRHHGEIITREAYDKAKAEQRKMDEAIREFMKK